MTFIGEHLVPGRIGHFFINLSFVSALLATISFFIASQKLELEIKNMWLRYARGLFITQALGIIATFGMVFYNSGGFGR